MDVMQKISVHYVTLSKAEKKTCDLIIENPQVIIDNPIASAAEIYQVSPSSILRFSKRIGYKGYSEFRYELERYQLEKKNESKSENCENYNNVLNTYKTTIDEMLLLDYEKDLIQLVKLLHTKNIITVGIGNSSLPAKQLVYTLYEEHVLAECFDDAVKLNFLENIIDSNNLIIIFSVSGNTDTYLSHVKTWKKTGAPLVLITTNPDSKLIEQCNLSFVLPSLPIRTVSNYSKTHYLDNRSIFFIFVDIIRAYYIAI